MKPKGKLRFQVNLKSASIGAEDPEITKVQKYLTRFGYLDNTISPGVLDKNTSTALQDFQQVMNLKTSGKLDSKTLEALEMPRCGSPDVGTLQATSGGASGSFVLRGCSYNKVRFTFRFVNGTADIAGTQERNAVRNAFNTWAAALCGVTFTEVTTDPADFRIEWTTGNHGDGSPFDGMGNVLAHAFYPPPCGGSNAGSFHFDDAETWSLTGAGATFDTETVALHEIGHLLGLDHSTVGGSVMFPSYGGVRRSLTQDDIDGIRRLYPFLCRRADSGSQAGFVSEIAAEHFGARRVMNAVRAQDGTLKLIAWDVANNGAFTRTGDSGSQAGAATSIAIARDPVTSSFVTACRNGSGNLFLISWNVNASGSTITRLSDSGTQAGAASMISIGAVGNNRFVTACRAGGSLKLISWRLNPNGTLTRLADSGTQAGAVSEIAMSTQANRAVTAVRDADGNLKLISWNVTNNSIVRLNDSGNQAGAARLIRVIHSQQDRVITAVKAGDNSLKLISWRVTASGVFTRLGDSGNLAGETQGHDISMLGTRVATGVRTGDGNLKVILWDIANNGSFTRLGDSGNLAGTASLITQCDGLSGTPTIITCENFDEFT